MNIAKVTISFDSMPQIAIGGVKKDFTELNVNGKTFKGVNLGNGTYAKLKERPDGKFDIKTFHGGGKDLSSFSVKVNGGTLSRMKTLDGQRFAGTGTNPLQGQTLRFNSDFANGYSASANKLDSNAPEKKKDKEDDKTISFTASLKTPEPKIEDKKKEWFEDTFFDQPMTAFFDDDEVDGKQSNKKDDKSPISKETISQHESEDLLDDVLNSISQEDPQSIDTKEVETLVNDILDHPENGLTKKTETEVEIETTTNKSSLPKEMPDMDRLEALLNELTEPSETSVKGIDLKLPGDASTPELDKAMKEILQK